MDQLDRVIGLLEEHGYEIPNDEQLAKIREMDEAVVGTREELESILKEFETKYKDYWSPLCTPSIRYRHSNFFPEIDQLGEYVQGDQLLGIHESRLNLFRTWLKGFAEKDYIILEDGGLKSVERAIQKRDKLRARGWPIGCLDLSRFRLVVPDLYCIEALFNEIRRSFLSLDSDFESLIIANFYSGEILNQETNERGPVIMKNSYYRSINFAFYSPQAEGVLEESLSTEIQLITERMRFVSQLNHPFDVAKTIEYPDDEMRDYVNYLMLKASILDFREHFGVD